MRTVSVILAVASSALAACSGTEKVDVRSLPDAVAVSGVAQPVAVSGVAQPVAVSGVAQPVAVSGVAQPVAVSSVATPVAVVRPELDPSRIETGTHLSGTLFVCGNRECRELLAGPFIVTDLVASGSSRFRAGPNFDSPRWILDVSSGFTITGARFAVRSGEVLFLEPFTGGVTWSGFVP